MLEISIGALSHRTGLPVSTIRFYDDNGLIQSNRNGGGHRRFERAQIRRVSFIIAAQKFGYTLPQIKTLLDSLPNERTPTVEDWAQLSEKFRKSLDEKIENLQNLVKKKNPVAEAGAKMMIDKLSKFSSAEP